MASLKVLVIGPSIDKSKGGMATVIKGLLNANNNYEVELKHIVSHVEGHPVEKLLTFFIAVCKVLLNRQFHLMHIHVASDISIFRKSVFVLIGKLLKKPIILHLHGADFDVYYKSAPSVLKRFIDIIFSKCDKIFVLTEYWKSFLQQNIPHSNVKVLYNGVRTEEFRACYTTPQNLANFLFLGRLCHRKGIYDLLEAINILVNKQNFKELNFFLAGDGDLEQVQKIIDQYSLSKHVQILGWLTDSEKKQWLKRVDTMILPSYSEGLPMAILEAMAGGKIIISSKTGGIPDVVSEKNGFLIEPGDVDSLCRYISFIYTNPQYVIELSVNNMLKVSECYDLNGINLQLFKTYYDLADMRSPSEKYRSSDTMQGHYVTHS